jgi:uncharacterized protein involved in type VI secretion and phage assembly
MATSGNISTRIGKIVNYIPQDHSATVKIFPEGWEDPTANITGYLPIASQFVGNGWGMFAAPTNGDLVIVTFQEDDINSGIITQRLFSDDSRPLNVPSGEFWLVHKSGSLLKFHNDGTVELTSSGALTIKAPSMALQNAGSALKKLVNETFLTLFDTHVHTNGNGGANTGTPTATSSASNKTTIVQAE